VSGLTPGRVVVAWAVGAAAVTFVVMVVLGVLPHTGTGEFLDPWRALGHTLAAPRTWIGTGVGLVVGAVVGVVHAIVIVRRRG
jgi:hypothetical protein